MRLLASTGPLFARPLDWALGVIAEAGYDGAELMVTQDPATQDAERVAKASQQEGLPVPVVHGPFLLLTRRVFGTDLVQKARRTIELAGDLDADVMIVHPPFRWQREFHRYLLGEGNAEAAEVGTRIGVENLYPVSVAGRPVRFHRYTLAEHLAPFDHVVLDTSHFGVAEADIVAAYERLRDRAVHLHVSDNRGGGRDSHAPLGHGILPLAGFLHAVAADAATGRGRAGRGEVSITLELDCRRYVDDRAALVGYLRQEREKCLALLGGAPAEEVLGRPDVVAVAPGALEDDADQPTAPPTAG
ncbi:sugar phosphate isomerase/epimerase family protein [Nitriliruptor alkaliphilus]|uniref:sugar phosphate isomerase/epimerase family protein n=1 Tax=Nitriliruptor alkaliphilus TaxID=427918 RepID=UPI000695BEFF|nr:sugar phosphate isomerase/epimerase [Nitriliruptor alkaliphilus]